METNTLILGGGIGGLWLLYELAKRDCDAILLQHNRFGEHSSIGNHRWLHSGAYFAAYSMQTVAEQCRDSSEKLRIFCQENCKQAISPQWGALLAFINQKEFERVMNAVTHFGVQPTALIGSELNIKEPALNSDLLRFGLFIREELTFDATAIVQALAGCCVNRGGAIYPSLKPLLSLSIKSIGGKWHVTDGRKTFVSEVLVCAAGALNPQLLHQINGRTMPNKIESTCVAVFHEPLSKGLLLIDRKWMISPLPGLSTASGHSDLKFIPEIGLDEISGDLETNMTNYLRHGRECKVGSYTCHKLNNSDDPFNKSFPAREFGLRHYFWTEEQEEGLFTFYPGLFTTAPISSQRFANLLADRSRSHITTSREKSRLFSRLATATLRNTPTHHASHRSQIWEVSRLGGNKK